MAQVFAGDIGTQIRLVTIDDLTTATLKQIKITKPDSTVMTKTATLSGTGTLIYTTVSGDFADAGTYQVRGYVEFGTNKFHTPKQSLLVEAL